MLDLNNSELFEWFEELSRMNLSQNVAECEPEDGSYRELFDTYMIVRQEVVDRLGIKFG